VGSGDNICHSIALDASGAAYITGDTEARRFSREAKALP